MKKMIILAVVALALMLGVNTASSSTPPYTETDQITYFFGQIPNAQWTVKYYVYHFEGEITTVYTLGSGAYSNNAGTVKDNVSLSELAFGYDPLGDAPIYEIEACLYPGFSYTGIPTACTSETYVGYYPERLWNYNG